MKHLLAAVAALIILLPGCAGFLEVQQDLIENPPLCDLQDKYTPEETELQNLRWICVDARKARVWISPDGHGMKVVPVSQPVE